MVGARCSMCFPKDEACSQAVSLHRLANHETSVREVLRAGAFALPLDALAQQNVAEHLKAGRPVVEGGEDVPAVVTVEHGGRLSFDCRSVDGLGGVLGAAALQSLHEVYDKLVIEEGAREPHTEGRSYRWAWLNPLDEPSRCVLA